MSVAGDLFQVINQSVGCSCRGVIFVAGGANEKMFNAWEKLMSCSMGISKIAFLLIGSA